MEPSSKQAKAKWRAQQRVLARAAFPLTDDQLQQLFDHIDGHLETERCDHSLSLTLDWLAQTGHSSERTLEWLSKHGGYCDCEVIANAAQHWEETRALGLQVPAGWVVTYIDPSLAGHDWESKEDLLQLRHVGLDRLADLGWYADQFRIYVLHGDFQRELLANVRAKDQKSARSALSDLLVRFAKP